MVLSQKPKPGVAVHNLDTAQLFDKLAREGIALKRVVPGRAGMIGLDACIDSGIEEALAGNPDSNALTVFSEKANIRISAHTPGCHSGIRGALEPFRLKFNRARSPELIDDTSCGCGASPPSASCLTSRNNFHAWHAV
jgi:hypothetical protein